jgi:hypothetical protein
LTGLSNNTTYYYQIISDSEITLATAACSLRTLSNPSIAIFPLTQSWRWNTNNLDGDPTWKNRTYDDSFWAGPNTALICDENSTGVSPRNTQVPPNFGATFNRVAVFPTYYFRTHFNFSAPISGVSLQFNNYIDDAAIFYLNGTEVSRVRMPAGPISYNSTGNGSSPCSGDAISSCPDLFTISGPLVETNLLAGDNVVAAEVHQALPGGTDMVFGCALSYSRPGAGEEAPTMTMTRTGANAIISWTGSGFALQQATAPTGPWTFVPGPATISPYTNSTADPASFYRMKN